MESEAKDLLDPDSKNPDSKIRLSTLYARLFGGAAFDAVCELGGCRVGVRALSSQ